MKYLSPTKFAPETYKKIPRKPCRNRAFERGIADLVAEARFLALLSHENIIRLHHVGRGSLVGQFNCQEGGGDDEGGHGHRFGFFLLLDPLFETLSARIERSYIPRAFDRPVALAADVDQNVVPFPRKRMHLSFGLLSSRSSSWWSLAMHPAKDPRDDSRLDAWRTDLAERLGVIKCIASGLAYLHDDCHAICRDVKPDNIGFYRCYRLVCCCGARSTGRDEGCSCYNEVPKIFDFGLCKELKSKLLMAHPDHGSDDMEDTYKLTGRSGTRRYMAPEVALSRPYNDKADVYSLGVTLYQVSSLITPFWDYSSARHEEEVLRGGDRPSLEIPSSRMVASFLAKKRGLNPYERWLVENDARMKYNRLELRTKCVWNSDLQRLISDCWQGDMKLRPTMRDVVARLEGCIQELTRIKRDVRVGLERDKMRMTCRNLSLSI
jgi:serine/threonine protein kinase